MARSHRRTLLVAMLAVGLAPALTVTVATWLVLQLATDLGRALPVLMVVDGLLVLSAAAFAWRMASALAHPIDRMRDGARLIVGPNPGHRVNAPAEDDLGEIARHLNALAERAQASRSESDAPLEDAGRECTATESVPAGPNEGEGARPAATPPSIVRPARRSLRQLSFAVVDLETTGLEPATGDRIVSIASVRVRAGRVDPADRFCALVDPGRPIPAASTRIHGITDEMVRGMPALDAVLPQLVVHVGDSVVVGHAIAFDLAFLEPALRAAGLPSLRRNGVLDTLLLANALLPALHPSTLEQLAALLGVTVVDRHTALGDASTTAEIFTGLIGLLEQHGIVCLEQALDLQRPSIIGRLTRVWPHGS